MDAGVHAQMQSLPVGSSLSGRMMCMSPHCAELGCCEDKCVCGFAVGGTSLSLRAASHTKGKVKDQGSGGSCGGKFAKLAPVFFDNSQINES